MAADVLADITIFDPPRTIAAKVLAVIENYDGRYLGAVARLRTRGTGNQIA